MPYKDPEQRKANQRANAARYREKHPEEARMASHVTHQKNRAEILDRMAKRRRVVGHAERPKKGPREKPEVKVASGRRYRFFKGPDEVTRIYFASLKGFTLEDMKALLKEFKEVLLPADIQAPAPVKKARRAAAT